MVAQVIVLYSALFVKGNLSRGWCSSYKCVPWRLMERCIRCQEGPAAAKGTSTDRDAIHERRHLAYLHNVCMYACVMRAVYTSMWVHFICMEYTQRV